MLLFHESQFPHRFENIMQCVTVLGPSMTYSPGRCHRDKGGWSGSYFPFKVCEGEAVPGGTAIPGQPLREAEQAPDFPSSVKNQFNIEAP